MRRKITLHGPSSLTVSLPPNWIKDNNLQKGDEIDMIEDDVGLIIKAVNGAIAIKSTEVDFENIDIETRKDLILTLHKKGYDEIQINFKNEKIAKETYSYLNKMNLGFEIIQQNIGNIVIRNLSSPDKDQFDNLFRRIFLITKEYSQKIEVILNDKDNITSTCLLHEASIKKISNICKRIVVKDKKSTMPYFLSIIESLEKISQCMTTLISETEETDKADLKVSTMYKEISNNYSYTYELFYKFSIDGYAKLKNSITKVKNAIEEEKLKNIQSLKSYLELEKIHAEIVNISSQTLAINL